MCMFQLIPPRGCAFVCFANRPDAHVALANLRGTRLMGSILKVLLIVVSFVVCFVRVLPVFFRCYIFDL